MKKVLLFTTTLSFSFTQLMSLAQSACVSTPTCSELGYTESSCPNGGLKCPFGNTWNCEITNYKDKITELEKEIEDLEQSISELANCQIGDILYSDKTCSPDIVSGKTPIGVIVYRNTNNQIQALALKSINSLTWSRNAFDCPQGLPESTYIVDAIQNVSSCENTKKIIAAAAGDAYAYPAAWAANEYKTVGTSAGDWCLPAPGIFASYFMNKNIIDLSFEKAGGDKFNTETHAWSSMLHTNITVWETGFSSNTSQFIEREKNVKTRLNEVRPVIELKL